MRFALAATIVLLHASLAFAQAPRLDGDGDPLPAGAVYRLGTKAWRHSGNAFSPTWSGDGQRLAMICNYREVRVLDGATGKTVLSFLPKDEAGGDLPQCFAIAFNPNGKEIAVRAMPARVIVVDAATGKHVKTFTLKAQDFGDNNGSLAYSRDGKYLGASLLQGYEVIERETGKSVIEAKTQGQIRGLYFTSDSSRVVVLGTNPPVQVWDLTKREVIKTSAKSATQNANRGASLSPDGKLVAMPGREVVVLNLDADSEAARLTYEDDLEGQFVETAFTADGKLLVATTQRGVIYVWNCADWSRKWKLTTSSYFSRGLAIRPDGKQVALTDARNRVWIWNLNDGKLVEETRPVHDAIISAVAFSPDGTLLATGSDGNDTHLWRAADGQHVRHLDTSSRRLAFVGGSSGLATIWNTSPQLKTWDLASGKTTSEWTAEVPSVLSMGLSPDLSHLVAITFDNQQRTYRVQRLEYPSLKPAGSLQRQGYFSGNPAISRGGRLVVVSTQTGVELCDLVAGEMLAELPAQTQITEAVLFTPDERYVLAACADKTIKVWELATCRLAQVLEGHKRNVWALALSSDGRMLVSAEGNTSGGLAVAAPPDPQQICFWNLATGERLATIDSHREDVASLALAPDDSRLIAGLRDTTAIVFDVPEAARQFGLPRQQLTADEAAEAWEQLGGDDAKAATAALVALGGDPAAALDLAESKLAPAAPLDEQMLATLVQGLDAEEFADRRAAFDKLAAFGSSIEPQLKTVIATTESGEVKLRAGELVKLMQRRYPQSGTTREQTRAVQLLEWIGDERALATLARLAGGAAEAHLTKEAKAALARRQ
jgi:WD40 repeat protein